MSESKHYAQPPNNSCALCKFYCAEDSTCRIRSAPGAFPVRKPVEFCFEFVSAYIDQKKIAIEKILSLSPDDKDWLAYIARLRQRNKEKYKYEVTHQAIDKDASWCEFLVKLRQDTSAKWPGAELQLRHVALAYKIEKLADFSKLTTDHLLAIKGIGKIRAYSLFEILATAGIFNTNVVSRTGETI